ncbi:heterokaryon incompatibility protein-domain-containing protein [Truncatella angustata]|uniref:Heterokaryon incompatibility protein-domain-containing protein n=1 Tax=Truncatella angustata TaxID=152316 RepID=A0A9P8UUL7_9PEZI|nr:heterokaryon incompatibility protein-domain-containing protein [Truncatella angustata]KAH6658305.1 heterokaryon incompatibility protein-domain-containing protein [Truncatella angustata]
MRHIDTQTLLLLQPWDAAGMDYAILSHTWGCDEVTFQEWEQVHPSGAIKGQCPHSNKPEHTIKIRQKSGYLKILGACDQARRDGIRYLWCDTICINKESSAELSEAINSMFKWYSNTLICYAYLTDVAPPMSQQRFRRARDIKPRFLSSRWWSRGWTLQELLAPQNVVFFAKDWSPLAHKTEMALSISNSTNIHKLALENRSTIPSFSVAQRMSWAADRTTTVPEDMAYCLLGIFDISIPMLYGEGNNAFRKLQEEIIKRSDDQSIFAWASYTCAIDAWTGAFAESPSSFRGCGSVVYDAEVTKLPFLQTNLGLRLTVACEHTSWASTVLMNYVVTKDKTVWGKLRTFVADFLFGSLFARGMTPYGKDLDRKSHWSACNRRTLYK